MKQGLILLVILAISASTLAGKFKHEPISSEAKKYVKETLKYNEIKKVCSEYDYKIFAMSVVTETTNLKTNEEIEWAVVDNIGTKMDLHIYGFTTTNGKVTKGFKLVHESADWKHYLEECKTHNKPIK